MGDRTFKSKVGEAAYLELIEAVKGIDAEAANLLDKITVLDSFEPCNKLDTAFTWDDTKQVHEYWQGIQGKLQEVGYYG